MMKNTVSVRVCVCEIGNRIKRRNSEFQILVKEKLISLMLNDLISASEFLASSLSWD